MTRKKKYNGDSDLVTLKAANQLASDKNAAELPWWMPDDLDNRAVRLADEMTMNLSERVVSALKHGDAEKLSPKQQRDLVSNVALSIMASPEYRRELAKWALIKPLEVFKLQVSLIPKNVTLEANHKHAHVIVVPGMADAQTWNDAHSQRKELGEGDWGTTLEDTPFLQYAETAPSED